MQIPAHPIKQIRTPIEITLTCRSKIKKWAFDNAYMLMFVLFLFAITWLWIFLSGVRSIAG